MPEQQLPRYRCHKEVSAVKILRVDPGREDGKGPGATLIVEGGFSPISVADTWVSKHDPKAGGYFVVYEDGYPSFSPAKAFEGGYTRIDE